MKNQNFFHSVSLPRRSTWVILVATIGLSFLAAACSGSAQAQVPVTGSTPTNQPGAGPTRPAPANGLKAYIGLFKDNSVAVLDTNTNQVLTRIPVPAGPHGLVMTPDGQRVFVSSDGDSKVSVIDTQRDTVVDTIEVGKNPHGLAITPDGKLVLVAVFGASQVVTIDAHTGAVTSQVSVPSPHNLAISPSGKTVYVASQAQTSPSLAILDIDKQTQVGSIPLTKVPRALNFSPDGKQLYFTQAGVNAVQVLDPATNQVTAQIPVGESPHHPLFTPDGQTALVVSQGPGQLYMLDPKAKMAVNVAKVGKMPHWIAVDSQGITAWVTNEGSNDVSVVDIASGIVTATIPVGNAPRKIVVQPQMRASTPMAAPSAGTSISIQGMAFSNPNVTVKVGQTITWTNQDTIPHTVTADRGQWDSGNIDPGKSFRLTLNTPGQYSYHCSIHPFMQGEITVTP